MNRWLAAAIALVFSALLLFVAACDGEPSEDERAADEPAMAIHNMPTVAQDEPTFLAHMIPHHQEAVEKASLVRERSEREEMRAFAASMMEHQQAEIDQMETWLQEGLGEEQHGGRHAPAHRAQPSADYRGMMPDLSDLDPEELDRVFLESMVMHHMMAIRMAQHLQEEDLVEHEEVSELTRSIIETQSSGVEQMSRWLAEWHDVELPMMAMRDEMPMHEQMREMHGGEGISAMMDRMHNRMHDMLHERTREHLDRMHERMHGEYRYE